MILRVEAVDKRLARRPVLRGASLDVAGPGLVTLVGANGSGKSTLLRVCAGVLRPDRGRVLVEGRPVLDRRAALGWVPERADLLPHLTPGELAALVAAIKRCEPPAAALVDRLGVSSYAHRPIGSLSLGQRRRAALLAALVGAPRLLLLDEPDNGLDPEGAAELAALLVELAGDTAVLVATHDATLRSRLPGRVLRVEGGQLVDAT